MRCDIQLCGGIKLFSQRLLVVLLPSRFYPCIFQWICLLIAVMFLQPARSRACPLPFPSRSIYHTHSIWFIVLFGFSRICHSFYLFIVVPGGSCCCCCLCLYFSISVICAAALRMYGYIYVSLMRYCPTSMLSNGSIHVFFLVHLLFCFAGVP